MNKFIVFNRLLSLSLFLLVSFSVLANTGHDMYPLKNKKQQAQYLHLMQELRCLVCQNQNLADSNASLAKDLKKQVYDMVIDNKSDSEIITYMTDRYGDFILFNPPLKALTYILWAAPALFLLLGLMIFAFKLKRLRKIK